MIVWKLDEVMRRKRAKGREMARAMGIGENYLSRVRHEVPDRLSLTLLDALCVELDCTIADLLEYRPGPQPMPEAASAPAPARPRRAPAARRPKAAIAPPLAPPEAAPAAMAIATDMLAAESPVLPAAGPSEIPPGAEPAAAASGGLSLAQRRAREKAQEEPPEPAPAVAPPAEDAGVAGGAAVVRTSALQAKLARLRRREAPGP